MKKTYKTNYDNNRVETSKTMYRILDGSVRYIDPRSITTNTIKMFSLACLDKLQEITIPSNVKVLEDYAFFRDSSLKYVNISSGLETIGNWVFSECKSLVSITFPDTLLSIGGDVFEKCTRLGTIIYNGTIQQWNQITLSTTWNKDIPATYVQCLDGQVQI